MELLSPSEWADSPDQDLRCLLPASTSGQTVGHGAGRGHRQLGTFRTGAETTRQAPPSWARTPFTAKAGTGCSAGVPSAYWSSDLFVAQLDRVALSPLIAMSLTSYFESPTVVSFLDLSIATYFTTSVTAVPVAYLPRSVSTFAPA